MACSASTKPGPGCGWAEESWGTAYRDPEAGKQEACLCLDQDHCGTGCLADSPSGCCSWGYIHGHGRPGSRLGQRFHPGESESIRVGNVRLAGLEQRLGSEEQRLVSCGAARREKC